MSKFRQYPRWLGFWTKSCGRRTDGGGQHAGPTRETHAPLDYQRLAVPYLLQLQERQQEVVESLAQPTEALSTHEKERDDAL